MSIFGFNEIDQPALRRYVASVASLGPVLACVVALFLGELNRTQVEIAVVLMVMAAFGERYPLQLTHKTTVNVASAAYLAMALTLPLQLPALLALFALSIGLDLRRRAVRTINAPEVLFNIGQGTLYTLAGAVAFDLASRRPYGPDVAGLGSVGAILATCIAMHLVNTGAVAGAAGLQMGVSPARVWRQSLTLDLAPQAALSAMGILAASVAIHSWYLLPLLALPVVLLQRAVQESVRLRAETRDALAALVEVVELRDPYTAGHSRRVAATGRAIAQQLGMTAEEADAIESAGQVHDIGKVAVDPHVLLKTSTLNDDEWAQMQLHPVHGANVVDRFAAYRQGARIVRHHHERWDGAGYPDRIAGEEIPLGARILAVADSFDAMTSDRPYRDGMPVERALAILAEGAGTQWDPAVIDAFVTLFAARPDDVPIYRRGEAMPQAASSQPAPAHASATEAA